MERLREPSEEMLHERRTKSWDLATLNLRGGHPAASIRGSHRRLLVTQLLGADLQSGRGIELS